MDVLEIYWDKIEELPFDEFSGQVIATNTTFFHGTFFVIACNDGKIRTLPINYSTIKFKHPQLGDKE